MNRNNKNFKQKVLVSGMIPRVAYDILVRKYEVEMHEQSNLLTKEEIKEKLVDKDALLCLLSDQIDEELIKSNPNLKVIANYGAGFNNIDIAAAGSLNIPVTNTPDISTDATADLALGLIIAIGRRIVEGDKETRAGRFKGWAPLYHLGVDVTGKTLGIIGMGNIGQAIVRRAKGFEMKVVYYTRTRLSLEQEQALGLQYLPFEEVIKNADYLTLSLSYSAATHHIIGQKELSLMKSNSYLINVARGPLVDEKALLEVLESKKIAGAALDVYELEPAITPGLEKLDNVILTPHIGNATVETRDAMAEIAANNIVAVLEGRGPLTCVNEHYLRREFGNTAK
ncbi:2-hydroxyacid dehydrogenase family protein [Desulfosporosinus lacus]|uniref:Lactate dehydrogenase n=1 Tax=Desulfosporosinus lacus DSM 15449 TaxID=1121420 RepID=A0A1M6E4P2_9FIRM|nr:2-hydroxyacid dehydrogenase family protein [Desulfosporosinus lacus]SHI80514.1 Lactate dehydrogenase [Desulfosporosinus lacus DSM 15449]